MQDTPLYFEFSSENEARGAADTLNELGYQASVTWGSTSPGLALTVEQADLTAALEVTQSHGGRLVHLHSSVTEEEAYCMAYDSEDMFPIPAHIVNEDWVDSDAAEPLRNRDDDGEDHEFDPSRDEYDHFSAGIRL